MLTTVSAIAMPAAAASQTTTPTPCGAWETGLAPTSDSASRTSPSSAIPTASRSRIESLLEVATHAEEREDGDARRTDGLHEAERRERERGHIDEPAGRLRAEADQPAAAAQQQPERAKRPADSERREHGCRVVLLRVGPVHGQRRDECQAETYPDCFDDTLPTGPGPSSRPELPTVAWSGCAGPGTARRSRAGRGSRAPTRSPSMRASR